MENLALRQRLAVYKRHSKRPRLRRSDRIFWVVQAGLWKGWRRVLVLVHLDTFAGNGSVSVDIGHNCPAGEEECGRAIDWQKQNDPRGECD